VRRFRAARRSRLSATGSRSRAPRARNHLVDRQHASRPRSTRWLGHRGAALYDEAACQSAPRSGGRIGLALACSSTGRPRPSSS